MKQGTLLESCQTCNHLSHLKVFYRLLSVQAWSRVGIG